jgi:PAS domain S-box-containing protein
MMIDLEGKIAYANNFVCDMLGFEPQELMGSSCLALVCPQDWSKAKILFNGYSQEEANSLSLSFCSKDGLPLAVTIERSPLREPSGLIYGFVATVMPLTGVSP